MHHNTLYYNIQLCNNEQVLCTYMLADFFYYAFISVDVDAILK